MTSLTLDRITHDNTWIVHVSCVQLGQTGPSTWERNPSERPCHKGPRNFRFSFASKCPLVLFIYPIDSITGPCCPGIHTPAGNSEHRTLHLTQGDAQCQQISLGLRRSRCMYDGMWRTRIEALRHGQWHIDTEAKAFPSMCNETKQVLPHLKQKISMQKHKTWFWCTVCSSHIHNGDNDSIFCSRRGVSLPIKNYFLRVIPFIISNPFSLLDSTLDPHPDPLF